MLTVKDIDFSNAVEVISSAVKYIVPVPKCEGEPLTYPADGDTYKKGETIKDWEGKPIQGSGLVFKNEKDNSWQAVFTNGLGVIICNMVTPEQAAHINELVNQLDVNPANWSLADTKWLINNIHTLGVTDTYNSDRMFIEAKMTKLEIQEKQTSVCGLYRRDDRDVCEAVFVSGPNEFQGPAATPQKFGTEGAWIVRQGESVRVVQDSIFKQTYRHKDGTSI